MGTKSTVKEKAKAYLESLSEKQKRGILIAMLVFTCIASVSYTHLRAHETLALISYAVFCL